MSRNIWKNILILPADNSSGERQSCGIKRVEIEKDKISAFAALRIKDFERNCIVGRLDFVESLLRRGIQGIKLTEVNVS